MEASLVEVSICAKFQVKIQKYDFSENLGSYKGSLESRHIKNSISRPEFSMGMNSFIILLVSPRPTCGRNMESTGVRQVGMFLVSPNHTEIDRNECGSHIR